MNSNIVTLVLMLSLSVYPAVARADWAHFGAAWSCTPAGFSIASTIESGSGNRDAAKGATSLSKEGKHVLHCKVGGARIVAALSVHLPDDQPGCGTNGYVDLLSLSVNGKPVGVPGAFVSYCDPDPDNMPYTGIAIVARKKSVAVTTCKGAWDGKASFADVVCKTDVLR